MKLKLDENVGARRAVERLRTGGHDVVTVVDQDLQSVPDEQLAEVCHRERRALVTLDLGFANPLLFNPSDHSGIVVIRLPAKPSVKDLDVALSTLLVALAEREISGRLWVVEAGRLREHEG